MIHHIEDTTEEVLPSQLAEREGVSPRVSMAQTFSYDPAVAAASAEVQELIEIGALPEAISAARRRLHDAIGAEQARVARERARKIDQTVKARKLAEQQHRDAEVARRTAPDSPEATIVMNSVRISVRPERLLDPAMRSMVSATLASCFRLMRREFEAPSDPQRLAHECRDILRASIKCGAATVEVI